jgi:hypothetical protein
MTEYCERNEFSKCLDFKIEDEFKYCPVCGKKLQDTIDILEYSDLNININNNFLKKIIKFIPINTIEFSKRAILLVFLFLVLSLSSFVLAFFEQLLEDHILITLFLTMLNGKKIFEIN